ncbi:hypothetical protein HZS_5111 [Henneguya salminicola]|nr:hypothetical protein HZS_5111 [Henneguya salminicola]
MKSRIDLKKLNGCLTVMVKPVLVKSARLSYCRLHSTLDGFTKVGFPKINNAIYGVPTQELTAM